MATVSTVIVSKNVINRAWSDLEPKLIAFGLTGVTATGIDAVAGYFGVHLPTGLDALIILAVAWVAGYFKSSTVKVSTAKTEPVVAAPGTTTVTPVPAPVVSPALFTPTPKPMPVVTAPAAPAAPVPTPATVTFMGQPALNSEFPAPAPINVESLVAAAHAADAAAILAAARAAADQTAARAADQAVLLAADQAAVQTAVPLAPVAPVAPVVEPAAVIQTVL